MATKLGRKTMPAGCTADEFTYKGRPAKEQGDFGTDVGLADMGCVNQFGESNNAKYYHAGVVQASSGAWFVYLEWGRMKAAKSWNGGFGGGDFMFVQCDGEADARAFFAKQCGSKNTKRLERKTIGGVEVWAGKAGKDGYLVQDLATREKGLPDAYKIKDNSGIAAKPAAAKKTAKKATKATRTFHPQVVSLANALVGGVQTYTRAMAAASGVSPTMATIDRVRDQFIPAALHRIKALGDNIELQVEDSDLVDISKAVMALVPRPIPGKGMDAADAIMNSNNILVLQQDLDAFEAALRNEDFDATTHDTGTNPDTLLNARLTWLDPKTEGKWLAAAFAAMTGHRHGYLRGNMRVRNLFAVERPDRDAKFNAAVAKVAAKRGGRISLKANLQPPKRADLGAAEAALFQQANVILGIHGTRPVNIAPIMQGNLRLPRSLPGAQITGANFGHGIYFATDWKKSYGYTGRGYWGHSGGDVSGRGCFMFLNDMIMGDAYRAPSCGSWSTPPQGKDSVFGVGGDRGHRLENDEHVIFDADYQRIRYVAEFEWLT